MGKYDVSAELRKAFTAESGEVDEGLYQKAHKEKTGKYDVIEGLKRLPIESPEEETGATSTITGEPIMRPSGKVVPGASIKAHMQAGFVDNPESKIALYAKDRFQDLPEEERLKRYGMRDGKIVYMGDDGKLYPEDRPDMVGTLKKGAAGIPSATPSAVLSGAGAFVGGMPGAMAGAAIGEGIRKGVGALAFGDKQTPMDYVKDMSLEAVFGMIGSGSGKATAGTINRQMMKKGGALKYAVKDDIKRGLISPQDHARATFVKTLADEHGITLAPHQLYDKQGMIDIWKYLRNHPQTSDSVKAFEDRLADKSDEAINRFIDSVAPANDPWSTGAKLKKASGEIIGEAEEARTKTVSPMYREAFDTFGKKKIYKFDKNEAGHITGTRSWNARVDIKSVLNEVDVLTEYAAKDGKTRSVLGKIKKMLYRETEKGNLVPETRLEVLDNVKKEIDVMLDGPESQSLHSDVKRRLTILKNNLLEKMDAASPEYAQARAKYAELSPAIDRLKTSSIGRMADKRSDSEIMKITDGLFSANQTSPMLVKETRRAIESKDPELWKSAVGNHIRKVYENLRTTETGKVLNVPGKMHKALFGSPRQREIMKAALAPDEYRNLESLMTVFKHASIGTGKESMTMPFKAIEDQFGKIPGSKIYRVSMFPKQAMVEAAFGKWNDILVRGRQSELLDALTSAQATKMIREMKGLKPGSKQMIEAVDSLATVAAGQIYFNSLKPISSKDIELGELPRKK